MKNNIAAIVLCGGLGSRISEITNKKPKSLIYINGKPLIWFVVKDLINLGIKKIIFPLGYRGHQIKKYLKKEFKKNLKSFDLVETGKYTEISERIFKVKKNLKGYDNFLLLNSDTLTGLNLKNFIKFHIKNNFNISMSGIKMKTSWGSIIKKKNDYKVYKFIKNGEMDTYQIKNYVNFLAYRNSGISIISTKYLNSIKLRKKKDFETDLYNKTSKIGSIILNSFWYPVETYKDYMYLKKNKILKEKVKKLILKLNEKK